MSAEWPVVTLGETVSFKTGKLDSNAASERGVYPFFTCSPTTLAIDEYAFDTEAVLLAGNNANGVFAVKYYKGKFNAYQRTYVITPLSGVEVDLKWLYFRIKHVTSELQQMSVGSATKFLTKKILDAFKIVLPPMSVQRKQSKILWDIQDKIDCNSQINQTLEQMAQAIFKSWFVDFEPVKAKIAALEAGGSEEEAVSAAMQVISGKDAEQLATMQAGQPEEYAELRATAELFPSAMQDSELGEMPEGWALRSLTHFGTVVCGKTPPKSQKEFFGGDIPFIKIPDMHGGAFNTKYSEYLSDAGGNSQSKKFIPTGSICVSCIATVGKVLLTHRKSQTNQQINSIIPKSQFLREYLYFQMIEKNKLLHDLASGGSATLNLNTGNFSKIELLMPDEVILARYSGVVSSLFNEILQNCMANETLTEIRDSLLPKLLSGEISVDSIHSDLTEEQLNATEVN